MMINRKGQESFELPFEALFPAGASRWVCDGRFDTSLPLS